MLLLLPAPAVGAGAGVGDATGHGGVAPATAGGTAGGGGPGVWGMKCGWIIGWGRVSDDDGHGSMMSSISLFCSHVSSISLLQTIRVFT